MSHKRNVLHWALLTLVLSGCDPMRVTYQTITFEVADSVSGRPIVNADVQIKPEDWTGEWFMGLTDENGQADVVIDKREIDYSTDDRPPTDRDVSGQPFVLRIVENGQMTPEVKVVMRPMAQVEAQSYNVTIVTFRKPHYVDYSEMITEGYQNKLYTIDPDRRSKRDPR